VLRSEVPNTVITIVVDRKKNFAAEFNNVKEQNRIFRNLLTLSNPEMR